MTFNPCVTNNRGLVKGVCQTAGVAKKSRLTYAGNTSVAATRPACINLHFTLFLLYTRF